MNNTSDLELIKLAQSGDTTAEAMLIVKYAHLTKALSRSYYLAGADKEDLLQVGTIGLLNAIRKFNPDGGASFSTFAYGCIRNSMLDEIRKSRRIAQADELEIPLPEGLRSGQSPEADYIQNETATLLADAISQVLNDTELAVLKLYLQAMSYEQIAGQLGIEKKKVDNTIQAARKKIRKLINSSHE